MFRSRSRVSLADSVSQYIRLLRVRPVRRQKVSIVCVALSVLAIIRAISTSKIPKEQPHVPTPAPPFYCCVLIQVPSIISYIKPEKIVSRSDDVRLLLFARASSEKNRSFSNRPFRDGFLHPWKFYRLAKSTNACHQETRFVNREG